MEILTALNHCLVSSVIAVTLLSNKVKLRQLYTHLLTQYSQTKITSLLFLNTVQKAGLMMYQSYVTGDAEKCP